MNAYEFETEVDSRLEWEKALIKSSRTPIEDGIINAVGQASVSGYVPVGIADRAML